MGMMVGKFVGDTIVVLDSFSLPVVGTETRVNPGADADAYMIDYTESLKSIGHKDVLCGWYHSHPGYGCWLSGIDVATQDLQQTLGPFIAVVVDPKHTISAGRVEIGAFRTYPKGYKAPSEIGMRSQTVPLAKSKDFGAHADRYYSMDITYFKSSLDSKILELLWHKYWATTLSSSPLLTNKSYSVRQISDLSEKFQLVDPEYVSSTKHASLHSEKTQTSLSNSAQDSAKIAREQMHNLIAMSLKQCLFDGKIPVAEAAASTETRTEESSVQSLSNTISLAREMETQQAKKSA